MSDRDPGRRSCCTGHNYDGKATFFCFSFTIFLGAFLLFQVQPLIAKFILPWFGGSPAVWTTCLLFFQFMLLAGYGYAHWVSNWKCRRRQGLIHICLLAATVFLLPILPGEEWRPTGDDLPSRHILSLLTVVVGGPYFVLSTTGPLLQAWFSASSGRSPYRFYALSNAGSLLGLVTYPFLFEPALTRYAQVLVWSVMYGLFVLGCGWCAWHSPWVAEPALPSRNSGRQLDESKTILADTSPSPSPGRIVSWIAIAASASTLLLATTNRMCQDLVVAFLWVLPLSIYLLTFIIAFDRELWYRRIWCIPLLAVSLALTGWLLHSDDSRSLGLQVSIYSLALFAGCMVCHGELAHNKPHPDHLTTFYLSIAAGGALGGIFVALLAPLLFTGYWEYHLGLAAVGAVGLVALFFGSTSRGQYNKRLRVRIPVLLAYAGFAAALAGAMVHEHSGALATSRSFYGVLKVWEWADEDRGPYRKLYHGNIVHGLQFMNPPWSALPVSYYGKDSGAWMAIQHYPLRSIGWPLTIGVVGLGAGTMAAYGDEGDTIRFYEINPDVIRISREYFRYWRDSTARVEVVPGDARIQLERELDRGREQQFDVLIIDAFSGDAIPMHLLTKECAEIYRRHLKDDGILALHISNKILDLKPVALGIAEVLEWEPVLIKSDQVPDFAFMTSTWVLITSNSFFLQSDAIQDARAEWPRSPAPLLWTDNFSSIFHVIK